MLKTYFLSALRHLRKDRISTIINITGFALGLTVCIIIALFVFDEMSYEQCHSDLENKYVVWYEEFTPEGESAPALIVSSAMAHALQENYPEVQEVVCTQCPGTLEISRTDDAAYANKKIAARTVLAEPNFFEIFNFEIIKGSFEPELLTRESVFLTESMASDLFGFDDPMGKPVKIVGEAPGFVAGIIKDLPRQTHMQFDILLPLLRSEENANWWDEWEIWAVNAYLVIENGTDLRELEKKIDTLIRANTELQDAYPHIFPMADMHLKLESMFADRINYNKGDYTSVLVLSGVAILIMLIASINFINLTTALAIKRAREVGLRKTLGATRWQLVLQYIGETVLLSFFATLIAAIAVEILLPYLSPVLGKDISDLTTSRPALFIPILGVVFIVGILSGIYPALVLSGFKITKVMKGEFRTDKSSSLMRKILISGQFIVSTFLIIIVLSINNQIHYMQTMDMGYDKDQVLELRVPYVRGGAANRASFIEALRKADVFESVSSATVLPGRNLMETYAIPEGYPEQESNFSLKTLFVDHEWLNTLDIPIVDGRNFLKGSEADSINSILVTEKTVKRAGWDNPIGKKVGYYDYKMNVINYQVVGVVKDFNFASAREDAQSMMIFYTPNSLRGWVYLKLKGNDAKAAITQIRQTFREFYPDDSPDFAFLDDHFARQYENDRLFNRIITIFSSVAIFIACLGLLGLAAFEVELRRKEFAIRKVLGSSVLSILWKVSSRFLVWVALANVIVWPLAWFAYRKWVEEFVYKAEFTIMPYLTAAGITIILAFITISLTSIKTANTNPSTILNSE